ncbi:hypothetical protein N9L68_00550 [bacterium]|nr:hypothetical protein [bacterium]
MAQPQAGPGTWLHWKTTSGEEKLRSKRKTNGCGRGMHESKTTSENGNSRGFVLAQAHCFQLSSRCSSAPRVLEPSSLQAVHRQGKA